MRLPRISTQSEFWTVKLPGGARVMSAPKDADLASPFGHFVLKVDTGKAESGGGSVHVKSTLTVTKMRIPASEYPAFRTWCEQVDKVLGQRLVVSTKGGT